ncbi:MAG: bifunctional folylpolyglutamate synthase/dihydrofolate synthase, partial [Clostridiales bacterium]|nr:bifunctional folylpolyglutamate synthase/dihydrofolate synthase [Clostridiales bacterium]
MDMDYEQTIDKIHSFSKFGSRLGLERMKILMDLLDNPQDQMKIIHVAGTNGKGSVCRFLATVLLENGYKVGLYTSPYLENFT